MHKRRLAPKLNLLRLDLRLGRQSQQRVVLRLLRVPRVLWRQVHCLVYCQVQRVLLLRQAPISTSIWEAQSQRKRRRKRIYAPF